MRAEFGVEVAQNPYATASLTGLIVLEGVRGTCASNTYRGVSTGAFASNAGVVTSE